MGPIDPRVKMSLERTMLSWTRTGLALMLFGFVIARFSLAPKDEFSLWIGILAIFMGIVVNLGAGMEYSNYLRQLKKNNFVEEKKWPMGRLLTLFLAIIGFGLCFYFVYHATYTHHI